jgi:hypothetical protein
MCAVYIASKIIINKDGKIEKRDIGLSLESVIQSLDLNGSK